MPRAEEAVVAAVGLVADVALEPRVGRGTPRRARPAGPHAKGREVRREDPAGGLGGRPRRARRFDQRRVLVVERRVVGLLLIGLLRDAVRHAVVARERRARVRPARRDGRGAPRRRLEGRHGRVDRRRPRRVLRLRGRDARRRGRVLDQRPGRLDERPLVVAPVVVVVVELLLDRDLADLAARPAQQLADVAHVRRHLRRRGAHLRGRALLLRRRKAAAQDDAVAAQAPSQILGAQRGGRRRRVEAAPQ